MNINARDNVLEVYVQDLVDFEKSVKESEHYFSYKDFVETQFILQGYDHKNIKDYNVVVLDECIGGKFEKQLQDFAKNLQAVIA